MIGAKLIETWTMAMRLPLHHFDGWCGTVYHTYL
jgi:hypothetical protein